MSRSGCLCHLCQCLPKLARQRMVCIVVKTTVLPPGVHFERYVLTHCPTPRQPLRTGVFDTSLQEGGFERICVEMRIPVRTWQSANVDQQVDRILFEEQEEVSECPA